MSGITTHVLDTARGKPAINVPVRLEYAERDLWSLVAESKTDDDGRCKDLYKEAPSVGNYRLIFDVESYLTPQKRAVFFPTVSICFRIERPAEHYHVPLLLTDFGYSTYRGS